MSEVFTQEQLSVPYNSNLLVTYKYIPDPSAGNTDHTQNYFMTNKVTEIEWALHQGRQDAVAGAERRKDIAWLEDQISEWYNPNYDKEDVLKGLIEHFNINPTKQVSVYGTVSFSGTINVPVAELEDFDLSNVTIDVDLNSYDYEADLMVDDVSLEEN
jgi:hypothetical protein